MNLNPEELIREAMRANPDVGDSDDTKGGLTMERLTTDTPKNNLEMALNLFYVKDKEVWVRGYGKNGADISLFDLSRDLTRWNCPYVDLDISDDSFSMMMAEWLWEDVESFEHVLALLYQAAWVCAELREHLKQFEDTKRTPEQIEALEAAIMGKAVAQITEFEGLPIARLRELAVADQEGHVIVLPCKVGQRVFALLGTDKHISECEVKQIDLGIVNGIGFVGLEPIGARGREYGVALKGFGKTVFLTREEAEKALAEME